MTVLELNKLEKAQKLMLKAQKLIDEVEVKQNGCPIIKSASSHLEDSIERIRYVEGVRTIEIKN